jgi:general secretion pathway protein C
METFFKKYFFIVNLAFLTLICILLGGLIGDYIDVKITSFTAKEGQSVKNSEAATETSHIKPSSAENIKSMLSSSRLFNADPPVEQVQEEEKKEDEVLEDTGQYEESELGVALMGTMVSKNPQWSFAIVKAEGSSKLIKIGISLLDRAEVLEIKRKYLIVLENNKKKIIRIGGEAKPAKGAAPSVGQPFGPTGKPPSMPGSVASATDYSKGVKKTGEYEYQIDKSMLDEQLQDLTKLGMEARVVPNYKDGKYEGFRLVGIRPDSLYRYIGIESGDVIKRINGQEIDTPNKALELFEKLKTSSAINLDVERRGKPVTLNYSIK